MDDSAFNEVRKKMGEKYKQFRLREKLSYRQLEAITGIDYSWISKFEKGQVNFEIDTLLRLVSGLKIQLKDVTDFTHSFVDE